MGAGYIVNKRWRLKFPKKRAKGVKAYYNRMDFHKDCKKIRYDEADIAIILTKKMNGKVVHDREIAKHLKTSVKAIQCKRCFLKKDIKNGI